MAQRRRCQSCQRCGTRSRAGSLSSLPRQRLIGRRTSKHGSALIMPASADEFADLEARLLAKQQLQFDALQKRLLGSAAAPTPEIDQPFSEYARNFYVTAALMVCLVASMVYLAITAGL